MKTTHTAVRGKRSMAQGFTILEVLMAVLVLTIGIIDIIGIQTIAIVSARATNNMRNASVLAETQLERLRRDSVLWVRSIGWDSSSSLGRAMASPGNWVRPAAEPAVDDVTYNQLGLPKLPESTRLGDGAATYSQLNSNFCLFYRVTRLGDESLGRVEVRVVWARNEAGDFLISQGCDTVMDPTNFGSDSLSEVVASTVLAPNPALSGGAL
ncbi:MAG: hypothetical protein HQ461_07950 [Deltaproteobacteria bacterium]|nr:hypothetical protein [Deltaproteobacteria bacterium]